MSKLLCLILLSLAIAGCFLSDKTKCATDPATPSSVPEATTPPAATPDNHAYTITPGPGPLGGIPVVGQYAVLVSLLLGGAAGATKVFRSKAKQTKNTVDDAIGEVLHDGVTYLTMAGQIIGIKPATFAPPVTIPDNKKDS